MRDVGGRPRRYREGLGGTRCRASEGMFETRARLGRRWVYPAWRSFLRSSRARSAVEVAGESSNCRNVHVGVQNALVLTEGLDEALGRVGAAGLGAEPLGELGQRGDGRRHAHGAVAARAGEALHALTARVLQQE